MRALGTVAEKLSFDPTTMGRADWDSLRSVGLDDEGCLEFAHIVGIFNHLTRLADGFGIKGRSGHRCGHGESPIARLSRAFPG